MKAMRIPGLIALALLVTAALLRFWVAPLAHDLPDGYVNTTQYAAETRFRPTPDGEWQITPVTARRLDQALISAGETVVIQSDLLWAADTGQVIFENSGLYGVNRHTRLNVPGYGDASREGQFLFPPNIDRAAFAYWDPMFIGLRHAVFDHAETLNGLTVYVFLFSGSEMDETAGYSYLAGVPERYRTLTDGQGTLWIEPLSGILVDYEETGTSYFVAAGTGQRIANFFEWTDRFTPETQVAQFDQAHAASQQILLFEVWLPAALLGIGLSVLAMGGFKRRP